MVKRFFEWMIYLSLAPVMLMLVVLDFVSGLLGDEDDWTPS